MEIKLYSNTAEKNKVNKTTNLTLLKTLSGTPIPPMNYERCSIIVEEVVTDTLTNYNYAYITEFKRYYFIVGKTWLGDTAYQLDLEEDYLYTWRVGIGSQYASIRRGSYENPEIADPEIIVKNSPHGIVTAMTTTSDWLTNLNEIFTDNTKIFTNTEHLCVAIMCEEYTYHDNYSGLDIQQTPTTGIVYLTLPAVELRKLLTTIIGYTGFTYETLNEVIREIFVVPYAIPYKTNLYCKGFSCPAGIQQGLNVNFGTAAPQIHIVNEEAGLRYNTEIRWHASFSHTDSLNCLNREPYYNIGIMFEPFGFIQLNAQNYSERGTSVTANMRKSGITLLGNYETLTGNIDLYAMPNNRPNSNTDFTELKEKIGNGNLKVNISLQYLVNNRDITLKQTIANLEQGMINGVLGGMNNGTWGLLGASGLFGSMLNQAVSPAWYNSPMKSVGGKSGTTLISSPNLHEVYYEYIKPNSSLKGNYSVVPTTLLSLYSGFTVVDAVHIENLGTGALQSEKDEVERLLKEGVIL